jgi:hypothetical protein
MAIIISCQVSIKSEYYQNRSQHYREKFLYSANIKTQLSHIIYTGQSCSFLTSDAIMGV